MFIPVKQQAPAEPESERKPDKIYEWRREVLEKAGYAQANAALLAINREVDLHKAVELLERCEDQLLATRILL